MSIAWPLWPLPSQVFVLSGLSWRAMRLGWVGRGGLGPPSSFLFLLFTSTFSFLLLGRTTLIGTSNVIGYGIW